MVQVGRGGRLRLWPAGWAQGGIAIRVLAVTALAWALILVDARGQELSASCCIPASFADGLTRGSWQMLLAHNPPAHLAAGWLLMLAAMMAPMLTAPIGHVVDSSFARRRAWSTLLFVLGYAGVWMAAGVPMLAVALVARLYVPGSWLPAATLAVVTVVWQCSPAKQYCLNRGHAYPALAAFAPDSDRDAVGFGVGQGLWCVGSCWALMLLTELLPAGHIPAMAAATLWLQAEMLDPHVRPAWRLRRATTAARLLVNRSRLVLCPSTS